MAQLGLFLWAIFFIVMGFSMMPGTMTIVMIVSFLCGLYDGITKERRKKRNRKPNFKLNEWERYF